MSKLLHAVKAIIRRSSSSESPDNLIRAVYARGIKLSLTQEYILRVLDRPMTDDDLFDAYHYEVQAPKMTAQGLRSRRAELAKLGLVQETGRVLSRHGRQARLWART